MLPTVIYMHRLNSSHFESYSGGSIEQKSLFYGHFFFSLGPPYRAPYRAPYGAPTGRSGGGGPGLRQSSWASLSARVGGSGSAFGSRLSARLRLSAQAFGWISGFRLSAWI